MFQRLKINWLAWVARRSFLSLDRRTKAIEALRALGDPQAVVALERIFVSACQEPVPFRDDYRHAIAARFRGSVAWVLDDADPNWIKSPTAQEAIPILAWDIIQPRTSHRTSEEALLNRLLDGGSRLRWDRSCPAMTALLCYFATTPDPRTEPMLQRIAPDRSCRPASRKTVRTLLRALSSGRRILAAMALGYAGDPRALQGLAAAFADPDLVEDAIKAVGRIGDPRGLDLLEKFLATGNETDKPGAVDAIAQIGGPRARNLLISILASNPSASVYELAVMRLCATRDPVAIEPLLKEVRERRGKDSMGYYIIKHLAEFPEPKIFDMLADLRTVDCVRSIKALAEVLTALDGPRAFAVLLDMIGAGHGLTVIPILDRLDAEWANRDESQSVVPALLKLVQQQYDRVATKPLDLLDPGWRARMHPDRDANLQRWVATGGPETWVKAHQGQWNHDDWLALLDKLRDSEYWPLETDAVGRVVDEERVRYPARCEALRAAEEAEARYQRLVLEQQPKPMPCGGHYEYHNWVFVDGYRDQFSTWRCSQCGKTKGTQSGFPPEADEP